MSRENDPLRAILALEERVQRARAVLQQTTEAHPEFERRLEALIRLVEERDAALLES